jgi:DNA-binding transcriptional ArsR family regulator
MRRNQPAQLALGAASVFAALGDETRLALVSRLSTQGSLSITELTSGTKVTRQAITKHLHVLADVGLVRGRRDGRENVWELEPHALREARHYLDLISQQWDDAIERLKRWVE